MAWSVIELYSDGRDTFYHVRSRVARRKGRGTISADLYSENDRSGKWVLDIPDRGSELGAEEMGAEIEVHGADAEEDVEEQIQLIYSCIEKKPDALLIAPADYSRTTEALRKVKESGIKLILLDSTIDQNIADAVVSTDNYVAGKELGKYTKKLINEDSVIGIVAHVQRNLYGYRKGTGNPRRIGEMRSRFRRLCFVILLMKKHMS